MYTNIKIYYNFPWVICYDKMPLPASYHNIHAINMCSHFFLISKIAIELAFPSYIYSSNFSTENNKKEIQNTVNV